MTFGLSMDLGAGARLEGTSEGYQDAAPGGVAVALGAWFAPSRVLELGLVGQRAQLGLERSAPVGRSVTVERYAYSAWLAARAFPLRSDTLGLFVQLGLGGSWQSVDVTGTRGAGFVTSAVGYACSTSDGPALALGAGLGLDAAIRREVALVAGVDVGAHQLSGDELGGCGPGAGTATLLTGRVGFVWRFDLAGSAEGAAGR
ncbi:MAG: hypothetical protein IT376_19365 [Polyangiaceae bacterium]|nr:hypothetical protein [Polyangiaceae bacterium]